MRKPLTPTSGRISLEFVSDRQNRCRFDDMAGWRYHDYAATYSPSAYIRYDRTSQEEEISQVVGENVSNWRKQGLSNREIRAAAEILSMALERRCS